MKPQFSIEKVENGYIATMDIASAIGTMVYTDFDELMDAVALHFDEIKIGKKYKQRGI